MNTSIFNTIRPLMLSYLAGAIVLMVAITGRADSDMPNACPIDGCEVKIIEITPAGDELQITFESNFTPDNSKNHFHVWWGDVFSVEQVGRNAETEHGVKQGRWHRHDDYPVYVTTGAASTTVRENTTLICVSAASRDHNILDVKKFHCVNAAEHL